MFSFKYLNIYLRCALFCEIMFLILINSFILKEMFFRLLIRLFHIDYYPSELLRIINLKNSIFLHLLTSIFNNELLLAQNYSIIYIIKLLVYHICSCT